MEIPRRSEERTRPVTRDREDGDLRIGDAEAARAITGLEVSQYATTDGLDNTFLTNMDTII